MIIYGIRTTKPKEGQVVLGYKCAQCNKYDTTKLYFGSIYVHIFWIPVFPAGKTAVGICENCNLTTKKDGMTPQLKENYERLKKNIKIPYWHFTGLAFLAVFFIIGLIGMSEENKWELEYLAKPKVGDVYAIKNSEHKGYYTIGKVIEVKTDSVVIAPNEYESNNKYDLKKIDLPANYSDEGIELEQTELLDRYKDGDLFDVYRK